jgi:hypothetical protein
MKNYFGNLSQDEKTNFERRQKRQI